MYKKYFQKKAGKKNAFKHQQWNKNKQENDFFA